MLNTTPSIALACRWYKCIIQMHIKFSPGSCTGEQITGHKKRTDILTRLLPGSGFMLAAQLNAYSESPCVFPNAVIQTSHIVADCVMASWDAHSCLQQIGNHALCWLMINIFGNCAVYCELYAIFARSVPWILRVVSWEQAKWRPGRQEATCPVTQATP